MNENYEQMTINELSALIPQLEVSEVTEVFKIIQQKKQQQEAKTKKEAQINKAIIKAIQDPEFQLPIIIEDENDLEELPQETLDEEIAKLIAQEDYTLDQTYHLLSKKELYNLTLNIEQTNNNKELETEIQTLNTTIINMQEQLSEKIAQNTEQENTINNLTLHQDNNQELNNTIAQLTTEKDELTSINNEKDTIIEDLKTTAQDQEKQLLQKSKEILSDPEIQTQEQLLNALTDLKNQPKENPNYSFFAKQYALVLEVPVEQIIQQIEDNKDEEHENPFKPILDPIRDLKKTVRIDQDNIQNLNNTITQLKTEKHEITAKKDDLAEANRKKADKINELKEQLLKRNQTLEDLNNQKMQPNTQPIQEEKPNFHDDVKVVKTQSPIKKIALGAGALIAVVAIVGTAYKMFPEKLATVTNQVQALIPKAEVKESNQASINLSDDQDLNDLSQANIQAPDNFIIEEPKIKENIKLPTQNTVAKKPIKKQNMISQSKLQSYINNSIIKSKVFLYNNKAYKKNDTFFGYKILYVSDTTQDVMLYNTKTEEMITITKK